MEGIDFVTLVRDVKECCVKYKGFCLHCPYKYTPPLICRLAVIKGEDLEYITTVYESRRIENEQSS